MNIPKKVTIHHGAVATDGGSIVLQGSDSSKNAIHIYLDWSLEAQAKGETKLSINGAIIEKRSLDERLLLDVLANADIKAAGELGKVMPDLINRLINKVASEQYGGAESQGEEGGSSEQFHGPCIICGKPGYVQAHHSEPISDIRCDEHKDTRTYNPISILVNTVVIIGLGLILYLAFILIMKLF